MAFSAPVKLDHGAEVEPLMFQGWWLVSRALSQLPRGTDSILGKCVPEIFAVMPDISGELVTWWPSTESCYRAAWVTLSDPPMGGRTKNSLINSLIKS